MQIVDNAPEIDLTKGLGDFEKTVSAARTSQKEPAEKDVKETKPASSADADANESLEGEAKPKTVEEYQAKIEALQKELKRRKGNAERVDQLEKSLEETKAELQAVKGAKKSETVTDELTKAVQALSDDDLSSKQVDWNEQLASLRSKYDRAEELGDTDKVERLGRQIAYAKSLLNAMRVEERARTERKRTEAAEQEAVAKSIHNELTSMYDALIENHPQFEDTDSELWKAGQAEFQAYPALMQRLGPVAHLVASAMAIVKYPELTGGKGKASDVRKETLESIDKGMKKALTRTPSGAPSNQRPSDIAVETGEGLAAFNRMVDRIKGG